ncbi:hypothetical protein ACOME3_010432 [Neoechinorhynchus agilis]
MDKLALLPEAWAFSRIENGKSIKLTLLYLMNDCGRQEKKDFELEVQGSRLILGDASDVVMMSKINGIEAMKAFEKRFGDSVYATALRDYLDSGAALSFRKLP